MNGSEHIVPVPPAPIGADPVPLSDVLDGLDIPTRPKTTWARRRELEFEMELDRSTEDVFLQIGERRLAAHRKHGANSIENTSGAAFGDWLAILMEEVGEVARALTYDGGGEAPDYKRTMEQVLRKVQDELLDVITVATAWHAAADRWLQPNGDDAEEN